MITVANTTYTAARIKFTFDRHNILIDELCEADKTLHIDSKVLGQAESKDEAEEIIELDIEEEMIQIPRLLNLPSSSRQNYSVRQLIQ